MWLRARRPEVGPKRRGLTPRAILTLGLSFSLLASGCHQASEDSVYPANQVGALQTTEAPGERIEVPPPPFSPGIYPCSMCHGMMPVNTTRRTLTAFHTEIVLKHDEEHRWCLDCHDAENRDQLHLASGEPVPFEESYRLCGQCHGEKYRDWRAGVHGRRTGDWNGHKSYLLCANCHNPHQPRFQPLKPEPAPIPPGETVGGRKP
jgi:hypothetical protein